MTALVGFGLHPREGVLVMCLGLVLVAGACGAAEAGANPLLSATQAVALAKKVFAEKNLEKRSALIAQAGASPIAKPEAIARWVVPSRYAEMKSEVRHGVPLPLPAELSSTPGAYSIGLPPKYAPNQRWPLIIGLHGGGSGQGDGATQYRSWHNIPQSGAIFVCPTSLDLDNRFYWRNPKNEELLRILIRTLQSEYPIDTDRIYLTGYSMGGIGTYYLGPRMSEWWAGIAPGAGSWNAIHWPVLLNTGVYLLHGKRDLRGPQFTDFPNAERAAESLTALGYSVKLQAVDADHSQGWTADEAKHMADWLLTHRRDPFPKRIVLASPCAQDFLVPVAPARPDRWLAITAIGSATQPMAALKPGSGGKERTTIAVVMGTLDATWVAQNRLEVTAVNVRSFTVRLAPKLVDFSKPLTVMVNGAEAFRGSVTTSLAYLLNDLCDRGDPSRWYVNEVAITVP